LKTKKFGFFGALFLPDLRCTGHTERLRNQDVFCLSETDCALAVDYTIEK